MKLIVLLTAVAAAALFFAASSQAHIPRSGCNSHLAPKAELACARHDANHALATIEWVKAEQSRTQLQTFDPQEVFRAEKLQDLLRDHRWLYHTMKARVKEARRRLAALAKPRAPAVDGCLQELIQRESGGSVTATNPISGAYGLPQALPGSKMASAGPDWATNAATQIRWMLGYVSRNYGGSCGALAFQIRNGWY